MKAPGRGADVQSAHAGQVGQAEIAQRPEQLDPAAADIGADLALDAHQRRLVDFGAGFVGALLADQHQPGADQRLGAFAAFGQAAVNKNLVEAGFQLTLPFASTTFLILFPAAARAGLVRSDLRPLAPEGFNRPIGRRCLSRLTPLRSLASPGQSFLLRTVPLLIRPLHGWNAISEGIYSPFFGVHRPPPRFFLLQLDAMGFGNAEGQLAQVIPCFTPTIRDHAPAPGDGLRRKLVAQLHNQALLEFKQNILIIKFHLLSSNSRMAGSASGTRDCPSTSTA